MMRRMIPAGVFSPLLFWLMCVALPCAAQTPPAPRVVNVIAEDGNILKGTYFSAGKPGPGFLLLHQCNRQRKVWDALASGMAASGINVLTVDFRGFGESGGTRAQMLIKQGKDVITDKWPADMESAFALLRSQKGVTRDLIGVGGASCGVNQAVQLARRHPQQVHALVLLSEGTDKEGRAFLRSSRNLPMFLAAADDDPDPAVADIMKWLAGISPDRANKFEHYSKGGHGVEMFAAHPELPKEIIEWVTANLQNARGNPNLSPSRGMDASVLDLTDQQGGAAKLAAMLEQARKTNSKANLFSEVVMNRIGYEHLQSGDRKGAIELLKLNAMAYPNSPNVYDSLGDAYLENGQNDLARESAIKALALLPSDTVDSKERRDEIKSNSEAKLKKLGAKPGSEH